MTGSNGTTARDVDWLVAGLAGDVPGVREVVLVSSDGLMLASARGPEAAGAAGDAEEQLGAIVSGLVALAEGTSRVLDMGAVRQEIVTMAEGYVVAMSISDGSCLGVHAGGSADLGVIAYQMTSFVRRAGHVLTPALRAQMHQDRGGGRVGS
ncbi:MULTISPECIES: roadblock/LC7 domain-containing protein [Embleya]|uniref:Dynein regulation protein LC7 n=2 Tax=Embleya TaxID=2699295 RepID=A0A1T3NW81_9ACTN|nr:MULTISPECIES: roadblock/LC7 domain-containing protein [Embleya]OPC81097.1 dynein regulation protein LC7 [Embleya scabrispora]GCD95129.1 dynein regulation protein LC7 [Embleya hyalina]